MKRVLSGALALIACMFTARAAGVKTVYILPMSGGLDNYVAECLSRGGAIRVTADPKHADAILTDRLGEDFERKLDQILPKDDDADDDDSKPGEVHYGNGRNRGTIFLVDAKTRQVLWSDYEKPPASTSTKNLNREAQRIAKKLEAGLAR